MHQPGNQTNVLIDGAFRRKNPPVCFCPTCKSEMVGKYCPKCSRRKPNVSMLDFSIRNYVRGWPVR